jgi:outer membrane protein
MKKSIVFLLVFINALHLFAQDVLTLEEAVAIALKNNYDIQLSKADSTVYAIDAAFIDYAFLPTINGNITKNFTRNRETNKYKGVVNRTDTSGISKANSWVAGVQLNWVLFDGLRMFATRDRIKELVSLGELGVKTQITTSIADVLKTYYNIVQQKQQLKAIVEQKAIGEERVKLADKKFSVGLGAKPELLQAKVDLNALISSQYKQNTLIEQLKEQLNQQMGVKKGILYEVVDTIIINQNLTLGMVSENINETNPSLLFAKKNINIAAITLKEVRAGYFPTVSAFTNYNFTRNNNTQNLNPFQLPFRQVNGFTGGVTASIPIFNAFNIKRQVKQQKLFILQQQLIYDNQFLQIDVAVKNAFKDYELQKKQLELEESNILLAKENTGIALERFRLGASTFIELREAQFSLADAYTRLIAARYNAKIAEIELSRLKGDLVR